MEPGKRPSFSILVQNLSWSLEQMAGYLHVGAIAREENLIHYDNIILGTTDYEASMEQAVHPI